MSCDTDSTKTHWMIRRQPNQCGCLGQTAYLLPTLSHSFPILATPPSCHIRSGWAGLQFPYPLDNRLDAGLVHEIKTVQFFLAGFAVAVQ
jgi:hypothetical protein